MKKPLWVWVRVGDGDDYHRFKDTQKALRHCKHNGVKGGISHWGSSGFATSSHAGYDYVSFYWGFADSNLERNLNTQEQTKAATYWESL